jgi:ABC-type uncharacterized transport system permease subunit
MTELLGTSLVAYFVASVLYLANLHIKQRLLASYGMVAVVIGLVLQTVRMGFQAAANDTPFSNAHEAIFFLAWAIALVYLVVLLKFKLPAVGSLAMPLSVIAMALGYRFSRPAGAPIAYDPWLRIHIAAIVLSLALFVLAFCCAVFYLVQNKLLKSKKLRGMFRRLPPLETIDSLGHVLAAIGFPLLTLGIVTAVVGVQTGKLQTQENIARLAFAGMTWAIYGAYLLAHGMSGWRGKRANWILIAGALLIALTTSLHRFV